MTRKAHAERKVTKLPIGELLESLEAQLDWSRWMTDRVDANLEMRNPLQATGQV
jgi:hypothetical protein